MLHFNSRSRTGSDKRICFLVLHCTVFQFTLPHRERHIMLFCLTTFACISIHAPAQGATGNVMRIRRRHMNFNSRSRTGSDKGEFSRFVEEAISIHAPAQGATNSVPNHIVGILFQFTLPHRERHCKHSNASGRNTFQFTLPHRERPFVLNASIFTLVFQFTLPHRERHTAAQVKLLIH